MAIEITNVGIKGPKGDQGQSGAPLTAVSGVPVKFINPAATFTSAAVSDNGAGKVLLTGAGAHGLSAADAVGANIYVVSGTGWTAGLAKILSLDADVTGNKIAVDVPFASQGSPSIAIGSTNIGYVLAEIPALGSNGFFQAEVLVSFKQTANAKWISLRSLNVNFAQENNLANKKSFNLRVRVHNRGATNSQVGQSNDMNGGIGSSTNSPNVAAIDFSAPRNLALTLGMYPTEPITLESYVVKAYA